MSLVRDIPSTLAMGTGNGDQATSITHVQANDHELHRTANVISWLSPRKHCRRQTRTDANSGRIAPGVSMSDYRTARSDDAI